MTFTDTSQRGRVLAAAAAMATLCAPTRIAAADAFEASLHAHAVGGVALVGDDATDETAATPLGGLAVRVSYARANWYQFDTQLTVATSGAAAFEEGSFRFNNEPAVVAPFTLTTRVARLDVGATFRFGVRLIPTVRVAVGVQERFRGAPVIALAGVEQPNADGRDGDMATDAVGVGAVGLDYRFGPRLIAGASVGGTVAYPFDGPSWRTLEASAHVAYYWYPLWFE